MDTGKLILGILAGFAAGATLGILLAPDKGSNTRKKLLSKEDGYLDEIKDYFNHLVEDFTSKTEEGKAEAANLVAQGKAKGNELKEVISSLHS